MKFELMGDTNWYDQFGNKKPIQKLANNHLKNIITFVETRRFKEEIALPDCYTNLLREFFNRNLFEESSEAILTKLALLDLYVEDAYNRWLANSLKELNGIHGDMAEYQIEEGISNYDKDNFYDEELILYLEVLHEKYEK